MATELKNNEYAVLKFAGKEINLPVVTGTEGDKALDIRTLRSETGLVTIDPGFVNTASCRSQITYIDGERGILRYRGIPIEELVKKSSFVDVAYLLVHGTLPTAQERLDFSSMLNLNSLIHEDMRRFFDHFPQGAHPMHILSTMINAMAAFYPNVDINTTTANIEQSCARVISIVRTIAAFAYKKSIGEPLVYPRHDLSYCANFLNMMFDSPVRPYHISPETVRLLNVLFILHADHEQNCSTSAVRVIGSAQVNLYATISAGISALSGPLHGGANQVKSLDVISACEDALDVCSSALSDNISVQHCSHVSMFKMDSVPVCYISSDLANSIIKIDDQGLRVSHVYIVDLIVRHRHELSVCVICSLDEFSPFEIVIHPLDSVASCDVPSIPFCNEFVLHLFHRLRDVFDED